MRQHGRAVRQVKPRVCVCGLRMVPDKLRQWTRRKRLPASHPALHPALPLPRLPPHAHSAAVNLEGANCRHGKSERWRGGNARSYLPDLGSPAVVRDLALRHVARAHASTARKHVLPTQLCRCQALWVVHGRNAIEKRPLALPVQVSSQSSQTPRARCPRGAPNKNARSNGTPHERNPGDEAEP